MSVFPVPKTEPGFYQTGTACSAESFSHISILFKGLRAE